jgi:peptidyl-prolyl cis-trans isomerase A (cyclophilin A)
MLKISVMKTLTTLALLFCISIPSFAADKAADKKTKNPVAVIKTNMGTITLKLFKDKAPKTVENFIGLAKGTKTWTDPKTNKEMKGKSLYKGTIFHRVIPDFMIQGGDPLGQGVGGPGYRFEDEFSPLDSFNKAGILAMANAGPNTNGSQFFITVAPTPHLNQRHTIFGEVTSGLDVVMKISKAERDAMDRPNKEVKIETITIK